MPGCGGRSEYERKRDFLGHLIGNIGLSTRNRHLLEADLSDECFVSTLVTKSEAELLRIPNFGRKGLNQLKSLLADHGLHLGMSAEELEKLEAPEVPTSGPQYVFPVSSGPDWDEIKDLIVGALGGSDSRNLKVWIGDPFDVVDHKYEVPVSDEDLKTLARASVDNTSFEITQEKTRAVVTFHYDPVSQKGTLTIVGKNTN